MQHNVENYHSLARAVIAMEEQIFRNLFDTTVMQFLVGTVEKASLLAEFRLYTPQWM
jgi:hypothetical protein